LNTKVVLDNPLKAASYAYPRKSKTPQPSLPLQILPPKNP
jgi:hypothetical protein